ncbi:hypothetical protein A2617_01600 [Candidatus Daviesbacteria bacterium RIFOXYD1_FULL_41_10]|uniref:Uncharacterized protein n=2 Tax=Candidatus Daviesiibacteriota TaxID=1752718 RepID=A0A1F5MZU0_9BACT|nr:MAG: hypothetical protein UU67_C0022G0019 [Candidatus Daviesbacteria bacterium GW2011_GWB1_41_5]OGE70760.1 MAG: hypothetical protein A2617_01600 [Candidatus Daviesbacteria bacterium RIFOXYD1_FULL_41_10]
MANQERNFRAAEPEGIRESMTSLRDRMDEIVSFVERMEMSLAIPLVCSGRVPLTDLQTWQKLGYEHARHFTDVLDALTEEVFEQPAEATIIGNPPEAIEVGGRKIPVNVADSFKGLKPPVIGRGDFNI